MYIPRSPVSPLSALEHEKLQSPPELLALSASSPRLSLSHLLAYLFGPDTPLRRRQVGISSDQNVNVTVGVVVGVVLALFIGGVVAFMYFYQKSLKKVNRRRRKSNASKGSRGSKASDSGPPPPPPPPPPAE